MNLFQFKRLGWVLAESLLNGLCVLEPYDDKCCTLVSKTVNITANLLRRVFTYFRIKLKILGIPSFLHLTCILKLKCLAYFLHLVWIFLKSLIVFLITENFSKLYIKKYNNLHLFSGGIWKKIRFEQCLFCCLKYFGWKLWQR